MNRTFSLLLVPKVGRMVRKIPKNGGQFGKPEPIKDENEKTPASIQLTPQDVRITCIVVPNAKFSTVKGVSDEGVQLKIAQPPVDGKANEEVVDYLSKLLGVKRRDVTLDAGAKSRSKVVTVSGVTVESVYAKLIEAKDDDV